MAGRRRAVGFLQIVPAKRRGVHSYETCCRKGRRKSRSNGWAAAGRGFPANCPSEAPGCTLTDCNWMRSVSHGSWRPTDRRRGETGRVKPMWRPPGAIRSCCHTPGCGALRAPHQGLCMVRPSGPNLAGQTGGFVRFGPKTAIIQWLCFCAVGA
ncbi:hypothetical protein J3R75_002912 [Oligosphaera ethanolica]|uniref:Uncharacterized protein n=1 Tax=Oligosphaera ethanolica TaxID=760260 RepID=A0AAE3VI46_9BACT|nr:hypothetical protein [Oligosphaera ethanolica]